MPEEKKLDMDAIEDTARTLTRLRDQLVVTEDGRAMFYTTRNGLIQLSIGGADFGGMNVGRLNEEFEQAINELTEIGKTLLEKPKYVNKLHKRITSNTGRMTAEEFIAKVREASAARIYLTQSISRITLEVLRSAEDDEIVATHIAPYPWEMSEESYAEFKKRLGEVLSEPAVYARIAVFGERPL